MLEESHFHFIGIGGIGMSAIALALLKKGFTVSGSDLIKNPQISALSDLGVTIFDKQESLNIDLLYKKYKHKKLIIVKSSAIKNNNNELIYCLNNNFTIKHRSEILYFLMKSYISISVAGTHGKTSTSTFTSTLLQLCTNDTSSIIGGIVPIYNSNSYLSDTKYLVAEIDESDGSIINYKSNLGIINNIELDHTDYYLNIDEMINSFKIFANNSEKILINYDCEVTSKNIFTSHQWSNKKIKGIEYSMIPNVLDKDYTSAEYYENGIFIDKFIIPIPGLHNLSNVTAAIAACRLKGVSIKKIKKNIKFLKLPKKRFELRGEFCKRKIIDDYAHHPNEIKATINLAKIFVKEKQDSRLVEIFQPHRYSRVKKFIKEFAKELSEADFIILTNIFSGGETNTFNINSQSIARLIEGKNTNIICLKDSHEIKQQFFKITNENDLIINMGAGDCHDLWEILNKEGR